MTALSMLLGPVYFSIDLGISPASPQQSTKETNPC